MKPILTIGMATHCDFAGVWMTIQSVRNDFIVKNQIDLLNKIQFVVIDNSPETESGRNTANYIEHVKKTNPTSKYVKFTDVEGTSVPRNLVFKHADSDYVVCMDSHLSVYPGSIQKLIEYYEQNPDDNDMLSGAIVYDGMSFNTHFNNQWRSEMWGTWGSAWKLGDQLFTVIQESGLCVFKSLTFAFETLELPSLPKNLNYSGHEKNLIALGAVQLGWDDNDDFEIPGMGLGMFVCKKSAWQKFNSDANGFGGEELYIHEKHRVAGYKCRCLGFLKWNHRFGKDLPIKYPISRFKKVRNYVLEFNDMGWSLDPIYNHFVKSDLLPKDQWEMLISDPINFKSENDCTSCRKNKLTADTKVVYPTIKNPTDALNYVKNIKRDLDEHLDTLVKYTEIIKAEGQSSVLEFSQRHESAVAFMSCGVRTLKSYNMEQDNMLIKHTVMLGDEETKLGNMIPHSWMITKKTLSMVEELEECDLTFLDIFGEADNVYSHLIAVNKVCKRFIILHDTKVYGESVTINNQNLPGMLPAIQRFLTENPMWSVVYDTDKQYGLMVLSRNERDKPKLPTMITMAANFTKALAKHVVDPKNVDVKVYEDRLKTCSTCIHRNEGRCSACGCPIETKALWASENCPLKKWENY